MHPTQCMRLTLYPLPAGSLLILPLRDTVTKVVNGVFMLRRESTGFDDVSAALREAVQRQAVAAMMVAQSFTRAALLAEISRAVGNASRHAVRFVVDGMTGKLKTSVAMLNGAFSTAYVNLVSHGTVVTVRLTYVLCMALMPCAMRFN